MHAGDEMNANAYLLYKNTHVIKHIWFTRGSITIANLHPKEAYKIIRSRYQYGVVQHLLSYLSTVSAYLQGPKCA